MSSETRQIRITLTETQISALEALKGIRGSTVSKVANSIITEWLYDENIYEEVDID